MKIFSNREIRALVLFVPLLLLIIIGMRLAQPKTDPAIIREAERATEERLPAAQPAPFDPNTVDYEGLRSLGLTKYEAASLLRYRAGSKIFRIPEDVALCYGFSDSLYRAIAPYIRIANRFAHTPRDYRRGRFLPEPLAPEPFLLDTVTARYLHAIGAFSLRQAKVLLDRRDHTGIYNMEELRACFVVSDSVATALEPYIIFPQQQPTPWEKPVELNGADSATLRSVEGIGLRTVSTILRYRERLGGFYRVEQLAEVPGVTQRNYEKILQQIYCDSCKIQKIDINFASPNVLGRHPYMAPQTLRRLLKQRQLKGGWDTAEELIEQHILTREEADRLRPYLKFDTRSGSDDR